MLGCSLTYSSLVNSGTQSHLGPTIDARASPLEPFPPLTYFGWQGADLRRCTLYTQAEQAVKTSLVLTQTAFAGDDQQCHYQRRKCYDREKDVRPEAPISDRTKTPTPREGVLYVFL